MSVEKRKIKEEKKLQKELKKLQKEKDLEDLENSPTEIVKIDQLLATTKPDILAVALGCPKQEILINENKDRWDIPLCLGIGASLDFAAGTMKRAPKWMSNHGLEWFYRMCQEPRRMFKRYIFRDWKFLQLLWKYRKNK